MKFPEASIMIFARAPVPGKVKTRLIPALGESLATDLHKHLVKHCVTAARDAGLCTVQLWCDAQPQHPYFQNLQLEQGCQLQTGSNLGDRMHGAFVQSTQQNEYSLVIGTDCPVLGAAQYSAALDCMREGNDAVIIPAEDGGYVLLGLRKPDRRIFQGIEWGSERVFKQTIQKLDKLGLKWKQLSEEWDIDRPEDVRRLYMQSGNLSLDGDFLALLKSHSGTILA